MKTWSILVGRFCGIGAGRKIRKLIVSKEIIYKNSEMFNNALIEEPGSLGSHGFLLGIRRLFWDTKTFFWAASVWYRWWWLSLHWYRWWRGWCSGGRREQLGSDWTYCPGSPANIELKLKWENYEKSLEICNARYLCINS